jgi:hypothetical protein
MRAMGQASKAFHVVVSTCVCAVLLWSLPAGARGNTQPPANDNYLNSINLNAPGKPLNSVATLSDTTDTIGATSQLNIFSPCGLGSCRSGPPEVGSCSGVGYGKSVWYDFFPDHDGQVAIRTTGIPNVIALYTYDARTLLPHEVSCATGSSYSSNELFAQVQRGVDYTYQIGGRRGVSGALQMRFNYAYRSHLTVAPFFTRYVAQTVNGRPDELKLLLLNVIGFVRREHLSYGCAFCGHAQFRRPVTHGNTVVVGTKSPAIVTAHTRLIIEATAPAQIGRFKLYGIDVAKHALSVVAQGCLAPGFSAASGAVAADSSLLKQVSCPTPALNSPGAEYVFWRGTNAGLWEKMYSSGRWSPALPLNAGGLASAPAVAVHANGEQDVFWKGTNGSLREIYYVGKWNGPISLAVGTGGLASAPSVAVDASGNQYVFWQGTDGALWEKVYSSGQWSPALPLYFSGRLGSAPAVAVHANGQQDVFWKGLKGGLWEMYYTGKWNGPFKLGVGRLASAPSVAVDASGNEYVVWQGTDGGLWEQVYSSGQWSRPLRLSTGRLGSAPAVGVHADGEQDVFWMGRNGSLRESYFIGRWTGPLKLGAGGLGSAPSVAVDASGKQTGGP